MDFGDILSQWDTQQREAKKKPKQTQPQISHKKPNAPTKEEKEAARQGYTYEQLMKKQAETSVTPMELWLRRYGTVDKDAAAEEYYEQTKMESREYLRVMKPEARIDLHGLTREEAWARLAAFVTESKNRGLKKILIIHGKGNHSHGSDPVLGEMVHTFIEQDKRLGSSGHPDRSMGGTGATWVIIKR
ncbi:MAG: Smr/MutS family protein [Treponema sp.]|nr:Smr/MutS family protein [Treponema sp.]